MTADEIVNFVADQLNLSAPDAKSRILKELNVRYRQLTSSIGLITTRRAEVSQPMTLNSQFVTFSGVERLDSVFYKTTHNSVVTNKTIDMITDEEMITETLLKSNPSKFSLYNVSPTAITIKVNSIVTTGTPPTLFAHAFVDASTLTGPSQPAFPESFHDILVHGVEADEYRRKHQNDEAQMSEQKYENRLSDLRMFIAKTAWQDIHRGKHTKSTDWWDYSRVT